VAYVKVLSQHFSGETERDTDTCSPGPDSNPRARDYEAEVLTARASC
jgi:hypothetical protein